jgi:hypothetical protein
MSKSFGPSTFFASDKNIYDALMQKKVPLSKLLDLLRDRGILVSEKIRREDVAIYISQTFIDYYMLQQISSFLEGGERKEKTTSTFVEASIEKDELISACQSVKDSIHNNGDTCEISQQGNTTKVLITYEEVDLSKTELRQRTTKTCEIEINKTEDGISIRQPSNLKTSSISAAIVESLSSTKSVELVPQIIDLQAFSEAEARSFFFERLIRSIDGYELEDVRAVSINHQRPDSAFDVDFEDEESEDMEDLDRDVTGYISKAVLAGTGVLQSSEFSQLHSKGFFISRIVWIAVDRHLTNDRRVELEAEFGNPVLCQDFKYVCKGFFERKEDGSFNITRKPFNPQEDKEMMTLLEKASRAAFKEVLEKYGESQK